MSMAYISVFKTFYLYQSAQVILYLLDSFNFFFWELIGKARWKDWNGSRHAVVCALIGNF
jgi:hypothetical protein